MKNQCNDKAYYPGFSILLQILNKCETLAISVMI